MAKHVVLTYLHFRILEFLLPSYPPLMDGIFPDINHPSIGVPPGLQEAAGHLKEFQQRFHEPQPVGTLQVPTEIAGVYIRF